MDLKGLGYCVVGWIHLAQDRDQVAGCRKHWNEHSVSVEGQEFVEVLCDC
jgi:hypothetical protein